MLEFDYKRDIEGMGYMVFALKRGIEGMGQGIEGMGYMMAFGERMGLDCFGMSLD